MERLMEVLALIHEANSLQAEQSQLPLEVENQAEYDWLEGQIDDLVKQADILLPDQLMVLWSSDQQSYAIFPVDLDPNRFADANPVVYQEQEVR